MSFIGILFSLLSNVSAVKDEEQDSRCNDWDSRGRVRSSRVRQRNEQTYTTPSTIGRVKVDVLIGFSHLPEPSPPGQLVWAASEVEVASGDWR